MATYVMSDIHGLWDKFEKMMDLLNLKNNDKVYFLGDVIDRGADGIKILQYILNDPHFTLLMGNHEYMMYQALEEGKGKLEINMEYIQWVLNRAQPTIDAFLELEESRQQKLFSTIKNLPVAITDLVVNDKKFYLTHGCYSELEKEGTLYLKDIDDPILFVWQRVDPNEVILQDKILVAGHTISTYYHGKYEIFHNKSDIMQSNYIDIDCGCSCNNEDCQFAALRLDDMKTFYVK